MIRAMGPNEAGAAQTYGGMQGLPFLPQLSPNQLMAAQYGGGRGFTPFTNPYGGMMPGAFLPNPGQVMALGQMQQQMGPMQAPNSKGGMAPPMQRQPGQGFGTQPGANGPAGWAPQTMGPESFGSVTGGIQQLRRAAGLDGGGGSVTAAIQQLRGAAGLPIGQPQVSSWSSQGQQAPQRIPWRGPGMGTSGIGGT